MEFLSQCTQVLSMPALYQKRREGFLSLWLQFDPFPSIVKFNFKPIEKSSLTEQAVRQRLHVVTKSTVQIHRPATHFYLNIMKVCYLRSTTSAIKRYLLSSGNGNLK